MGSPRQRWWDGTRWTDDLHDPALEVYGVTAPPVLGPTTAVYNRMIWAIALLPLVTLMSTLSIDLTAQMQTMIEDPAAPSSSEQVVSNLASFGVHAGSIALAFFDRRRLLQIGVTKPFHWAWAFLWSGVYVIGRSVIVRRRADRGMAPAWVWLGIFAVSLMVGVSRTIEAVNVVFPNGSFPT